MPRDLSVFIGPLVTEEEEDKKVDGMVVADAEDGVEEDGVEEDTIPPATTACCSCCDCSG